MLNYRMTADVRRLSSERLNSSKCSKKLPACSRRNCLRPASLRSSGAAEEGKTLPPINWQRFHVQVLFVDSSDTVRARVAAAFTESIATWNGFGRTILPWTCGVAVPPTAASVSGTTGSTHTALASSTAPAAPLLFEEGNGGMGRTVAVMSGVASLGLELRPFARATERFEALDLDLHDLVIAMDRDVREAMLQQVDPSYREQYADKVLLLSQFAANAPDSLVLASGGLALLPSRLSAVLRGATGGTSSRLDVERSAVDIATPVLTGADGAAMWAHMVRVTLLGTAGLVKHLMDEYPPGLHWEPID